jgi:hypothetical protein
MRGFGVIAQGTTSDGCLPGIFGASEGIRLDTPEAGDRQDKPAPFVGPRSSGGMWEGRPHPWKARGSWPRGAFRRFIQNVAVAGPDECWLWKAGRSDDGYGAFLFAGAMARAHRVALQFHLDRQLLESELVLHSCDTPACVNPKHLRVGTQTENMADMDSRGRRGSNNRPKAIATRRRNFRLARIAAYFGNGT